MLEPGEYLIHYRVPYACGTIEGNSIASLTKLSESMGEAVDFIRGLIANNLDSDPLKRPTGPVIICNMMRLK